jgi:hypothetical protein
MFSNKKNPHWISNQWGNHEGDQLNPSDGSAFQFLIFIPPH